MNICFENLVSFLNCSSSYGKTKLSENQGLGRIRKPFHFRNSLSNIYQTGESTIPSTPELPTDTAEEATYSRYKYYQRLRGAPKEDSALVNLVKIISSLNPIGY